MPTRKVWGRLACKCTKCQHVWFARDQIPPAVCPQCKSPWWNRVAKRKYQLARD